PTARPPPYPLSLHDALPICSSSASPPAASTASRTRCSPPCGSASAATWRRSERSGSGALRRPRLLRGHGRPGLQEDLPGLAVARSEEHTSELQSRVDLVCRL